jgi:hypothetical protein
MEFYFNIIKVYFKFEIQSGSHKIWHFYNLNRASLIRVVFLSKTVPKSANKNKPKTSKNKKSH